MRFKGVKVPDQGISAGSGGSFPSGGGELGALIRQFDWTKTNLGPLAAWPQSLKTITDTLLRSPVPIVLLWGEDGVMIYNDAYSGFAGGRHPELLGSKVRDGWAEVADFNDHVMRVGVSGGTLAYRDQELTLCRHGRPEQVWMNLDYSPVLNEAGEPAGVIAIVVETTQRVIAERTLKDRENELARVQQIARIGGVTVDLENGFDNGHRSPEYLEIHGLSPDAVDTHGDWVKRIHPDDRDRTLLHFLRTVNGADARYSSEYRIIRPSDGQVRWIACEAQIERDENGKPLRMVGATWTSPNGRWPRNCSEKAKSVSGSSLTARRCRCGSANWTAPAASQIRPTWIFLAWNMRGRSSSIGARFFIPTIYRGS